MAPKFIYSIPITLIFVLFSPTFQATSIPLTTLTTQTCHYPCIPPPITTTNCPPPPLPPLPPSPPTMPLPPELPFIPPPPGPVIWAAPPPPNPIWPYFPWYYKYPPPPPDFSTARSLSPSTVTFSCILFVLLLVFVCF